jgi:putative ABC transport system permease protein
MGRLRRLGNLFRQAEVSQAISEELQFHIRERVDELVEQGVSEPEARRLARLQFGSLAGYQEETGDLDLPRTLQSLVEDLRYAVRSLWRAPSFTVAAIATLALGIGATTAIYSMVHTVWLRPLPFRDPERVVRVWETNLPLGIHRFSASVPNFASWCERSRSFDSLVAFEGRSANLTGVGEPERVRAIAVTAGFLDTLGIQPLRGRAFVPGEDLTGRRRVVMLSERLWRRRYGGDPGLVGRTVSVNGESRTVIGIAPNDVAFAGDLDVWEPLVLEPAREDRGNHHIKVLGRLKAGVDPGEAEAELDRIAAQLQREFPASNRDWRVTLAPALEWIVGHDTRLALLLLMGAAGLLLLVASVNVASLSVARALSRAQEFGVRRALGAGRLRLARQLAVECLVLAFAGGVAALLVAWLGVRGLRVILPADLPRVADLSLDLPVLAVAGALTLATALVSGLAPAWTAARARTQDRLRHGRGATAGATPQRLRQVLVAGEFALATLLVTGAFLLLVSFQRLRAIPLGFQPESVLTARISLPAAKYSESRALAFYGELEAELKAEGGIQAAGVASIVPLAGGDSSMEAAPFHGSPPLPEQFVNASYRIVTPGYFQTLGIPLVHGRLFDARDEASGRPVVLSEGLARRLWSDGRDPTGRLVQLGANQPHTVIGVVGDVKQLVFNEDPRPTEYLPLSWYVPDTMFVVVRATGDPGQLAPALRRAVARLDPQQPVFAVKTFTALLDGGRARERLNTVLVGAFALLGLALGVIGIGGIVSYSVVQRTPEMAVRMALGATAEQVVRLVAGAGLKVGLVGVLAGLAGAYALGQAMSGLLYGVRPDDPAILGVVALALLAAALLASWLPARRLARVDPAVALRQE